MIDRDALERVARELQKHQLDFFDIYVEDRTDLSLTIENRKLERPSFGSVFGASIRLIAQGVTYFAVVDNPTPDKLIRAAKDLAASATVLPAEPGKVFQATTMEAPLKLSEWVEWEALSQVRDFLLAVDDLARSYDPRVSQVSASVAQVRSRVQILNGFGYYAEDTRVRTQVRTAVWAEADGLREAASSVQGKSGGLELLDRFKPDYFAFNAAKVAVAKLNAVPAPAGEFPVILAPGFGGVIFHEAVGHGLEADEVGKQVSVFRGKLGQKIGSEKVTLVDSGLVPNEWGSTAFDDEGFPNQETVLIKDGELVSYMCDYLWHMLAGFPHTSSGRRESYAHIPYPRMRNTYLKPGSDNFEDMLLSIKKGVMASKFGGGQVDPVTGNFIFGVTEGYLIEDGRITAPIKDVSMVGNGLSILQNVVAVSKEGDLDFFPGMCGKEGQSVPAALGQPYVMLSKILLGGE